MDIKKLGLLLFAFLGLLTNAYAQPTGVYTAEVEQVHYGDVGGQDLTGYVTYNIYAHFTNEDDFLSAIYGLNTLPPPPGTADDITPMSVENDCDCYDAPTGSYVISPIVNEFICPFAPLDCIDSFWTIGKRYFNQPGQVLSAFSIPTDAEANSTNFCEVVIEDGAVFTLFGEPNGVVGPDLKILIAVITTCSDEFTLNFGLQTFVGGEQANQDYVAPQDVTFTNPCVENAIDPNLTVTQELLCFGETATVETGGGGNNEVTFELFEIDGNDTLLVESQLNDPSFDLIVEGDYFIAISDTVGCLDTSADFSIVEPPELVVTIDQTSDNLCFGDELGEFCPTISGGIPPYNIEIQNPDGTTTQIDEGECFSNLGCFNGQGNYTIVITDQNGCEYTEDVEVFCASEIVVEAVTNPILCNGDASGSIELDITGGTGNLTIDFTDPDFVQVVQPSPIILTIEDIDPGIHTLTVTDENGCSFTQEFDLQEPDALEAIFNTVDVLCFGDCTGSVNLVASGGTFPYTLTILDENDEEQDATALCSGVYTAIATDGNGCTVEQEVTIGQPDQITFSTVLTDVSCFGAGDGEICVSDVSGGTGVVQWQITSPPTEATELGTLDCFTGLDAANYTVTFEDEDGCTNQIVGVTIDEPSELEIVTTPTNVTCNGSDNGMIEVTSVGGTGAVSLTQPEEQLLPFTIMDLAPDVYNVVIQDETGCQDSVLVEITQPDSVQIEVLGVTNISCGGDCDGTVQVDLSGGTGELSLELNGEPSITVGLCANEYEAVVIDENFCTDTANFEIVQPDPIEFLISIDPVTCTGMNDGSVIVFPQGGEGPISFEIFGAEGEEIDINNLFEGEYTVTGQDSTGCIADSTFLMPAEIETDMQVTVFTSPVTCWNEADGTATAAVTGGELPITYQWNDAGEQTTATAIGLPEEVYSVTVTDAIGCTLSFLAEVEPTVGCFFIADAITPNGDGANDEWVIGGLEFFPLSTVQVYNRWGQLLFESEGYGIPWDGKFNGNELPAADYYYVITYDENKEPIVGTVTLKY